MTYCFPKSSTKFQGHAGQKFCNFYPNWAFPDCKSSLNSQMDLKWYTKLKNWLFESNLSKITRPVAVIKSLRFALLLCLSNAPVPLLRTLSASQYELAFVAHRSAPYWFELPLISSLPLSYWPCESTPFRIASYCIAERRINSCQFLLVRISSLNIRIDSL